MWKFLFSPWTENAQLKICIVMLSARVAQLELALDKLGEHEQLEWIDKNWKKLNGKANDQTGT